MELQLCVKHGPKEFQVVAAPNSTVAALKQQLEQHTGVFVRNQKLIYKGKVLDDASSLQASKVSTGAKIMLLQTEGLPVKGQPAAAKSILVQQRLAAAAAARGKASVGSSGTGGSSLLAEKMANMAAARAAAGAAGRSTSAAAAALSLPERRSAWSKTGIIALRDMQLAEVQAEWLEGVSGARAADFSHNHLTSLPATLCQLSSLVSLKLSSNCLQDSGMPWQQLCSGLSSLTSLLLGHNQLQVVPACLGKLTGLVQLRLEGNCLKQVEAGAFGGLVKLEVLQLQDNQLVQLPEDLGCCSSMVALNVSRNALPALPESLAQLAKLQVLAVDNNRLTALPAQLLVGCSSLATLSAHQNPITVEHLRVAEGYAGYEARRQARATKQLEGHVMADIDKAFSEGADVEQWQRWAAGPTGLGSDGSGRAGK